MKFFLKKTRGTCISLRYTSRVCLLTNKTKMLRTRCSLLARSCFFLWNEVMPFSLESWPVSYRESCLKQGNEIICVIYYRWGLCATLVNLINVYCQVMVLFEAHSAALYLYEMWPPSYFVSCGGLNFVFQFWFAWIWMHDVSSWGVSEAIIS
jgi:hypothetical protein